MIAPEWVAVSGFGRRRSLPDLAVWGFPEFSRKIFPLKPFPPLFAPFSPSRAFPPILSPPQTPPSNSLEQVCISPFYPLALLFFLQLLPTLSRHLLATSIGPPKRPFLGLFRGFPPKLPKGPKYPFLGPF